ncbi:hypothetical protein ABZ946_33095 [Streptomyces sp. NPDC046324]|uniref:hypothetical protein n=1 Tax=Streptomyces sp. NPDC046324 TaxID=3154915 RepID=UPI0033EAB21B
MRVTVNVGDVNGTPLHGAHVTLVFTAPGPLPTSLTVRPGQAVDVTLARDEIEVTVVMDGFAAERFVFGSGGAGSGWQSSNPAGQAFLLGPELHVNTVIGTVRLAPTVAVDPNHPLPGNPGAALVDDVGEPDWIYRGARHNRETIHRLDEPVFGDLTAMEWQRFKHSVIPVDLASRGRFVLLEYGAQPQTAPGGGGGGTGGGGGGGARLPRFLTGAWVPFAPLGPAPEVVVFYSPPTFPDRGYPPDSYPFLGAYPYAVTAPQSPKTAEQPYVGILVNYLLVGYKIVYQMLAAGRNPVVIMPSQPSTDWGPLDTQPGLARLIKEVLRFLYARQLVAAHSAPQVKLRLLNGRTHLFPWDGPRGSGRLPGRFTATVSGFSAGINAVVKLCTADRLDEKRYPPELFHAPAAHLTSNWRELWDIDGVDSQGRQHMVTAFRGWLAGPGADRRSLRAYHSQDTYSGPENGLVPRDRVVRKPSAPVTGVYVEEGSTEDGRVTWVHFSNPALLGDVKAPGHQKTIPEFGTLDAHHMVPAIAFGHAAQFPLR